MKNCPRLISTMVCPPPQSESSSRDTGWVKHKIIHQHGASGGLCRVFVILGVWYAQWSVAIAVCNVELSLRWASEMEICHYSVIECDQMVSVLYLRVIRVDTCLSVLFKNFIPG